MDSPHSIRIISQIGGRNPAHCTGVGKVMLAGISERELRVRGYAIDNEEIEVGLRCVAAPIRNHTGEIVAAMSISGPTGRMSDLRLHDITKDIVDRANWISVQLGYNMSRTVL